MTNQLNEPCTKTEYRKPVQPPVISDLRNRALDAELAHELKLIEMEYGV